MSGAAHQVAYNRSLAIVTCSLYCIALVELVEILWKAYSSHQKLSPDVVALVHLLVFTPLLTLATLAVVWGIWSFIGASALDWSTRFAAAIMAIFALSAVLRIIEVIFYFLPIEVFAGNSRISDGVTGLMMIAAGLTIYFGRAVLYGGNLPYADVRDFAVLLLPLFPIAWGGMMILLNSGATGASDDVTRDANQMGHLMLFFTCLFAGTMTFNCIRLDDETDDPRTM